MKIFFLSLFLLVSCSDDSFQKVEELKSFRILGIRASNPEVGAGGSSSLQLLISDVNGGGRVIPGTYESCVDPGISNGAPVTCEFDPSKVSGSFSIDTTPFAATFYTDLMTPAPVINVTVPATIFVGRSSREQSNGVSYITIFNFNVDGETIRAFKRINATTRTGSNLNTNPANPTVTVNGGAIRKPSKGDEFNAITSAPQSFDFINTDGSTINRPEETELAWYVSVGKLSSPKSNPDEAVEYLDDPPANSLLILTIVRDERGGLGFLSQVVP